MKNFKEKTNKFGFGGVVASVLAQFLIIGIVYFVVQAITGIDLEAIDNYFIAVLAWMPFVFIAHLFKYFIFEKWLPLKWHFWLGNYEILLFALSVLFLGLTGDVLA